MCKRFLSLLLCAVVLFFSFFSPVFSPFSVASAAPVGTIIGWISTALDVWSLFEPLITAINKSNTEAFLKSKSAYLAFWEESDVTEKFTKSEFLTFCEIVMSGDIDRFSSVYGSDLVPKMSYYYDIICKAAFYAGGYEGLADLLYSGGSDGYILTDENQVQIPSSDFKDAVEEANTNNAPKGKGLFKQSYRTDKVIHSNYDSWYITLFNNSGTFDGFEDLYLYPFYCDADGIYYYTNYQYHFYYVPHDDPNSDLAVYMDVYEYRDELGYILDDSLCKIVLELSSDSKPFTIGINPPNVNNNLIAPYYSYDDYTKNIAGSSRAYCGTSSNPQTKYYSLDGSSLNLNFLSPYNFLKSYAYNVADSVSDTGFICSHELISRQYTDIDTSKIPDNYYVTISGDTIYDYSITNPETGDSDTINNYITNNYTYITNNNGDSGSSGSGTVGGNIIVDGKVDVGGSVAVDVNVNVNGGGGGITVNPGDYIDVSDVDGNLDSYLELVPEVSNGFINFLKDFFAWLPAEIYGLIILGLVVAVFCRVAGR